MRRTLPALLVVLLVVLVVAALVWLGSRDHPRRDVELVRDRAAAHFLRDELDEARAALAPLVARRSAAVEDLVRAAIVEYADRASGDPTRFFERIRARAPEHPALHYMEGRRALEAGRFEAALEHFTTAQREAPADLPARVCMGQALDYLERTDEAQAVLRAVVERGLEHGGSWYTMAIYLLGQSAAQSGADDEALQLMTLHAQLYDLGFPSPAPRDVDRGWLAIVQPPRPPRPGPLGGAARGVLPAFTAEPPFCPELARASELLVLDAAAGAPPDLLGAGPEGVVHVRRPATGHETELVMAGPARLLRVFDLGNDDTLDLLVARDDELVLLEAPSGADVLGLGPGRAPVTSRWAPSPLTLPRLPAPPEDMLLVDFDHEGDLDLLVVGPFGAYLLRDDGAAARPDVPRGGFTEVGAAAGLPRGVALAWCASEDLDGDQDVDLLLGGPGVLFLMDNLRAERFVDVAAERFGAGRALAGEPVLADFDGDFRTDLVEPPATFWRQQVDGTFRPEPTRHALPSVAPPLVADLDLDGTADLVWAAAGGGVAGMLGFGLPVAAPFRIDGAVAQALVVADFDNDLDNDLVLSGPAGLHVLACQGPVGHAARIAPLGLKDNRRAVGAVVEARTRGSYRRIYWRGGAELLGFGTHAALDVLRITWPNGVVQGHLDLGSGGQALLDLAGGLEQSDGLIGSCPFLYAWDGTTFRFVSDVLGGTPLGLPMAPGVLVPPDHDEYVLVRGHELVPRDGFLELQFTEELREVTYLDRIRLEVVDHPAGTEVYPNERFTFPPFPEHHVHTVAAPLAPRAALGSDGRDWSAELAAVDDVHAAPFEPLAPQFAGLATPHWLELAFDPERVRDAPRLRLVGTGWFFWTDASVNVASARTPGVEFVPPILQLPGPEGTWEDAGPPLGFPAGKTKTMVVDVTQLLDRDDPRLRLRSTLRLYWDSIRLAVDGDDAPLAVTALEPASAVLWPRGFSEPSPSTRADLPERFDWARRSTAMRWDQHPGRYTRYGGTLPLLQAIDDRFVILGSGDALHVRFDARDLPPPAPGRVRDYLVFLDGWAKDRDPNTLEALAVEPLPFHGMSGYPYGPGERFPDGPEHAAWRAEWNTREARRWIPPLAPAREAEWALDGARR